MAKQKKFGKQYTRAEIAEAINEHCDYFDYFQTYVFDRFTDDDKRLTDWACEEFAELDISNGDILDSFIGGHWLNDAPKRVTEQPQVQQTTVADLRKVLENLPDIAVINLFVISIDGNTALARIERVDSAHGNLNITAHVFDPLDPEDK